MNDLLNVPSEILRYQLLGMSVGTWLLLAHLAAQALGRAVTALRSGGGIKTICMSIWGGSTTTKTETK